MNSSRNENNSNICILCIDKHLRWESIYQSYPSDGIRCNITRDYLVEIVNQLGDESAQAQNLQLPITTASKFTNNSSDDLIFIIFGVDDGGVLLTVIGFIRFGKRDLYFDDGSSLKHIPNCQCILDFYIRLKRNGYGKVLFDTVLDQLGLKPEYLAYDRPSDAMLTFLRSHYCLNQPLWQHNHFVIFHSIFSK